MLLITQVPRVADIRYYLSLTYDINDIITQNFIGLIIIIIIAHNLTIFVNLLKQSTACQLSGEKMIYFSPQDGMGWNGLDGYLRMTWVKKHLYGSTEILFCYARRVFKLWGLILWRRSESASGGHRLHLSCFQLSISGNLWKFFGEVSFIVLRFLKIEDQYWETPGKLENWKQNNEGTIDVQTS